MRCSSCSTRRSWLQTVACLAVRDSVHSSRSSTSVQSSPSSSAARITSGVLAGRRSGFRRVRRGRSLDCGQTDGRPVDGGLSETGAGRHRHHSTPCSDRLNWLRYIVLAPAPTHYTLYAPSSPTMDSRPSLTTCVINQHFASKQSYTIYYNSCTVDRNVQSINSAIGCPSDLKTRTMGLYTVFQKKFTPRTFVIKV